VVNQTDFTNLLNVNVGAGGTLASTVYITDNSKCSGGIGNFGGGRTRYAYWRTTQTLTHTDLTPVFINISIVKAAGSTSWGIR
jgi:hypothetical protein